MFSAFLSGIDVFAPSLLLVYVYFIKRQIRRGDYIFLFVLMLFALHATSKIISPFVDNNLYLYHLICLGGFGILFRYFIELLNISKRDFWARIFPALFVLYYLSGLLFWENLLEFPSLANAFSSLILVFLCLLYFLRKFSSIGADSIIRAPDFWFVTGLLTYFGTSFFIFASYRLLTQRNIENVGVLWQVHNLFLAIMVVYFFIGYSCKPSLKRLR